MFGFCECLMPATEHTPPHPPGLYVGKSNETKKECLTFKIIRPTDTKKVLVERGML